MSALERFVDGFHDYLARALSPLAARLAALEASRPERGPQGEKGLDGKDGRDGIDGAPGADGRDGIDGKDGAPGADGKDGRDGIDGKSFTIEDVRGMLEGECAKWALDFERRAQDTLQRAIERIPTPKDGAPGRDGVDGLGFDDMTVERTSDRGFALVWSRDGQARRHELSLPAVIDRGVYAAGKAYEEGDGVTHLGSYWIAQVDGPTDLPGTVPDQWRLAVRKGRDGRHGKDGEKGDQGLPGRPARD